MRRLLAPAVGLALVLGLAACGSAADPAEPAAAATTAPADPVEELKASTKEIEAGNYSFTFSGGPLVGSGYVHKPSGSTKLDMTHTDSDGKITAQLRVADSATLVKLGLNGESLEGGGKWLRLDAAKAKDSELVGFLADADVPGATELIANARNVGAKDGNLTGTVDLNNVKEVPLIDDNTLEDVGNFANVVPFTATLDPQGRLTKFELNFAPVSGGKLKTFEIEYADYGAVTPEAAPADAVAAPADFYERLG